MARRRAKVAEGRRRDPTLVLFLALNMILLAFFILLVSLSAPDEEKEAQVALQVQKAFRSFGGTFLRLGSHVEKSGISQDQSLKSTDELEQFLGELSRFAEQNLETRVLSYEIVSEGLHINLSSAFSFEEGSDVLRESALPVYNALYKMILRTTNPVRIEGHTDNIPFRSPQVRDNWQLSGLRAMRVFRFFMSKGGIPPQRIQVVGRADTQPQVSNLTEAGRARNRRVTIVFLGKLRPVEGA